MGWGLYGGHWSGLFGSGWGRKDVRSFLSTSRGGGLTALAESRLSSQRAPGQTRLTGLPGSDPFRIGGGMTVLPLAGGASWSSAWELAVVNAFGNVTVVAVGT